MSDICPTCGLPKELCMCEEIAREQQSVKITLDNRRYGKTVTIVEGIDSGDIDVSDLAKTLKSKCATGGTYKDGRIELQGDHQKKVRQTLESMGFNVQLK